MKVLVLVEDYPSESSHAMMYVHVRNVYYKKNDIDVTVLNFRAKKKYKYDNIDVITMSEYEQENKYYDILICHAANLKHHYKFLKKYENKFKKIVFFYHGHEILKINEVYPPNYKWAKKENKLIRNIYDTIKLKLWKKEISKLLYKSQLVFVSNWLYHRFLYYVHINPKLLEGHVSIINNSVGSIFEDERYDKNVEKEYDFISIRGTALDGGKYGIDIVTNLAELNPNLKFLVIGKGNFYKYNNKPQNLVYIEKILKHQEMIEYLNKSRCALLPTKQDTQGVLTCEMATFGIPTITSDIEVCKEMFNGVHNVRFINNDNLNSNLEEILEMLENSRNESECLKFLAQNTIKKEIDIFEKF